MQFIGSVLEGASKVLKVIPDLEGNSAEPDDEYEDDDDYEEDGTPSPDLEEGREQVRSATVARRLLIQQFLADSLQTGSETVHLRTINNKARYLAQGVILHTESNGREVIIARGDTPFVSFVRMVQETFTRHRMLKLDNWEAGKRDGIYDLVDTDSSEDEDEPAPHPSHTESDREVVVNVEPTVVGEQGPGPEALVASSRKRIPAPGHFPNAPPVFTTTGNLAPPTYTETEEAELYVIYGLKLWRLYLKDRLLNRMEHVVYHSVAQMAATEPQMPVSEATKRVENQLDKILKLSASEEAALDGMGALAEKLAEQIESGGSLGEVLSYARELQEAVKKANQRRKRLALEWRRPIHSTQT